MVKFTKARDELLIELVKGHKILFDASDENFKNNILKHKSWEEISAIVGVPVTECKKRWKSLRDQYNKKKKGDISGGERTNSTWEYMNLMSFLTDTVERRENMTNCDNPMQQMVVELVEDENTDDEDQREESNDEKCHQSIIDEVSQDDPLNTEESTVVRSKRRLIKRKFEPITKITAKRRQKSAMYEKTINKVPDIKTATQKFFESMADIVDKLPTHLQAEVRLKVCQIVTEAELKHHTQHALYPNLQSQSYNQFSNIVEYPNTPTTQHTSNSNEYVRTPIPSNKFKVDLD